MTDSNQKERKNEQMKKEREQENKKNMAQKDGYQTIIQDHRKWDDF